MTSNNESLVYSVEEAGKKLGISRSLAYSLARARKLPGVIFLGHRLVVSRRMIEAVLNGEIQFNEKSQS
jgi:predicted DNA-binding transcriptional regulator AlpA